MATLLDEKFQFKLRKDLGIIDLDGFESCFVELNMKGMVIGEIYRVPNTPLKNFFSKYETILEKISMENETIVIGTDQNLDYQNIIKYKPTKNFFEKNLECSLVPTISIPTRVQHTCKTLIDNIYLKNVKNGYDYNAIFQTIFHAY